MILFIKGKNSKKHEAGLPIISGMTKAISSSFQKLQKSINSAG